MLFFIVNSVTNNEFLLFSFMYLEENEKNYEDGMGSYISFGKEVIFL